MLTKTSNLQLELLAWNVIGENELSLLLRNDGQNQIDRIAAEWLYVDPTEDRLACTKRDLKNPRLDCLIYSFLVMTPEVFNSPKTNKVVGILISDGATVCYPYGELTADKCTVH